MKNAIVIFTVLLVLWIAGSSYWYVCKIRNNCNGPVAASEVVKETTTLPPVTADTLPEAPVEAELSPPPPYSLLFASAKGQCVIDQAATEHFKLIAQYLGQKPGKKVSVRGHADNTGSDELNMALSKQRAEFVKKQLVSSGVSQESVDMAARGESDPIADNGTEEGKARNRRVEIVIN